MCINDYWHTATVNCLIHRYTAALVCTWIGERLNMSISVDSPSNETLDRGPLALPLQGQYEFPFGINVVEFSSFFFLM